MFSMCLNTNMKLFRKKTTELSAREERLIFAMQLLGDKTRFKIFKMLVTQMDVCVTDAAPVLDITPSAVSQHLKKFEMTGLIIKQRMGQKICYMLKKDDELVQELVDIVFKTSKRRG